MRAVAGTQSVVFTNLQPGPYAVIVFHDENDKGKLDKDLWECPPKATDLATMLKGF